MNTAIKEALNNEIDRILNEMNIEFNTYCDLPLNERDDKKHYKIMNSLANQRKGIEKAIEIIDRYSVPV